MAKGVLLVGPYLVHVIGTRTGMAQARPARTTEGYGTVPAVPSRPKAERARASDPVGPLNGGVKTSSNSDCTEYPMRSHPMDTRNESNPTPNKSLTSFHHAPPRLQRPKSSLRPPPRRVR